MKVAVLMSTYNGEKYLREQIDSILKQKGEFQLDLWVRDDGSSDQTVSILKEYEEKNKLQWYCGENLGPARSFIDLIRHCRGYDYYLFADQDDVWFPEKVLAAINKISIQDGIRLYFCNAIQVNGQLQKGGGNIYTHSPKMDFETFSCAGGILGCTMVFCDGLARIIANKETPRKIVMHDFYLAQVCLAFGGNIIFDEIPHMFYRQHGNNAVGVGSGIIGKIKYRFKYFTERPAVSISDQAHSIIDLYEGEISIKKKEYLLKISQYHDTITNQFALAFSRDIHYASFNMAIVLRLSILLGNR